MVRRFPTFWLKNKHVGFHDVEERGCVLQNGLRERVCCVLGAQYPCYPIKFSFFVVLAEWEDVDLEAILRGFSIFSNNIENRSAIHKGFQLEF